MEASITYLMLEHHKKINKILESLLNGFGMDKNAIKDNWQKFEEITEAHMKTEEQVIFSFTSLGNNETQKLIGELLLEHSFIRNIINDIDKNFDVNFAVNIFDLQKKLYGHESKENNVFYPMLDAQLDEHGRNFLIKKIKAI